MSDPKRPDDPSRPPIADVASLFDSNEVHTLQPSPNADSPSTSPKGVEDDPGEYGLEVPHAVARPKPAATPPPRVPRPKPASTSQHFDPTDDDEPAPKPKPATPSSRSDSKIRVERSTRHDIDPESDSSDRAPTRTKRRSSDRAIGFDDADEPDRSVETEGEEVDPIWTRGAEWGPDLVKVGLAALGTLIVAYFSLGSIGFAFLVLLVGGAACVVLSYPILVTMERPIRITPEQAINDFFAAASHHVPHYRRMWLLLSPTARSIGQFSDFADFEGMWSRRMVGWKEGRGGRFTPLHFQVREFKGDKSVGQTTANVDYTVQVFVRGHEAEKPIASYRMMHGLVKGPDRMWYLNQGTLNSGGR